MAGRLLGLYNDFANENFDGIRQISITIVEEILHIARTHMRHSFEIICLHKSTFVTSNGFESVTTMDK